MCKGFTLTLTLTLALALALALALSSIRYVNLGDVVFRLASSHDSGYDYYWLSRDSALLIKGGSNYAYEQINVELAAFVANEYRLPAADVEVAVVGLRLCSEHEDGAMQCRSNSRYTPCE